MRGSASRLPGEGFAARLPPVQSDNNFAPEELFQNREKAAIAWGRLLRTGFQNVGRSGKMFAGELLNIGEPRIIDPARGHRSPGSAGLRLVQARASIGQYLLAPRRDHEQVSVLLDVTANNEIQDFGFLFGVERRCLTEIAQDGNLFVGKHG